MAKRLNELTKIQKEELIVAINELNLADNDFVVVNTWLQLHGYNSSAFIEDIMKTIKDDSQESEE